MKRIMVLYENCKMPIRVLFFGFILISFGFLIQNESVNLFYTFTSPFILRLSEGSLLLGKAIVMNSPLIFMIYLVCKKANSGIPIVLALLGYFTFLITTSLFASQSLSSYAYASGLGINSLIKLTDITRYPLETGMIGSFIVAYITRYSFISSRYKMSNNLLSFLNRDTAAIVYCVVFCFLAGIAVSYIFPFIYQYLNDINISISKDLANPIKIGLYGMLDRGLSVLGLGDFIRYPFWYTALGGSYQTLSGQSVFGDVNIWPIIKDATTTYSGCGRFITPYYVINMFMIPAIYFGFLSSISDKQEKNHFVLPFILGSILSIIAGNPLPVEMLMLFTCPLLFVFYLFIVGTVFGVMTSANVFLGSNIAAASSTIAAMPGNFPDYIINLRSVIHFDTLLNILIIGVVSALVTYIVVYVYFHLVAFNLVNSTRDQALVNETIEALGGYDNITNAASGLFRVNFAIDNIELVSFEQLSSLGSNKISETKTGISIDFGSSSYIISKMINNVLAELGRK